MEIEIVIGENNNSMLNNEVILEILHMQKNGLVFRKPNRKISLIRIITTHGQRMTIREMMSNNILREKLKQIIQQYNKLGYLLLNQNIPKQYRYL